jgi:hypothetical protein
LVFSRISKAPVLIGAQLGGSAADEDEVADSRRIGLVACALTFEVRRMTFLP